MNLKIIGAESMGVRNLCCSVFLSNRRIVIDPGVSLSSVRYGLPPHPLQIALRFKTREMILHAPYDATDIVFSHFHGDHVPLAETNPYQLSIQALPHAFRNLRCWNKGADDLSVNMNKRFQDLADLLGNNMLIAEGRSEGELSSSQSVPMARGKTIWVPG